MPTQRLIQYGRGRGAPPRTVVLGQKRKTSEDFYHQILDRRWSTLFALVVSVFLLANALFGAAYLIVPGSIAGARPGSLADAFFFSVETMATVGYGELTPANLYAHVLVTVEALTGVMSFA